MDLCNKYKAIHDEFINLKEQCNKHASIEYNLDIIIENLLNNPLVNALDDLISVNNRLNIFKRVW